MQILRACILTAFALGLGIWQSLAMASPFRTLQFEHIKVKQGLQPGPITAIVQDAQGFIWIGGQQGLSRFDGYKFSIYKNIPGDPGSLDDNWIRTLHVDKTGQLWIGSNNGGLHLYDRINNKFKRYYSPDFTTSPTSEHTIRALIGDGDSGLWIGSRNGLKHFSPSKEEFTIFQNEPSNPDSLIENTVTSLALDEGKNLWVGTRLGLDRKPPGSKQFIHYQIDTSANKDGSQKTVRSLMVDHQQHLWVGTNNALEVWDLKAEYSKQPKHRQFGPAENWLPGVVARIYQDQDHGIWINMADKGLLRWEESSQKFFIFQHQPGIPESLSDNQLETIYQDRTGSLWIGSWSGGVNRVDLGSGGFTNFAHMPASAGTVTNSKISYISEQKDGLLWISTGGKGMLLYDPLSGKELAAIKETAKDSASINDIDIVGTFNIQPSGHIWAATRAGLASVDEKKGKLVLRPQKPGEPATKFTINEIYSDPESILWIASVTGLLRFDTRLDQLQIYKHQAGNTHSLVHNTVNTILPAENGKLWLGTMRGLELFDPSSGQFQHFQHDQERSDSITNNNVAHLFYDSKKNLWLGTETGLSKLTGWKNQQPQFQNYSTAQPINCLLEDKQGQLWISLENEISRFDPVSGSFKNYSYADGLGDNGFYLHSCHQSRDGNMFFGSSSGLISFKPENIKDNAVAPQVLITDLLIFNQSVTNGKFPKGFSMQGQIQDAREIVLNHKHAIFSLEFSALHYADTQSNKFAYQLQGFDEDWVITDASKRYATYTNLDPGEYIFKVTAANKDGVWNETGRSLKITVTPPFWQTLWFRLLLAAFLLGSIWTIYLWRVRNFILQKQVLEKEINNRTMEVSAQKTELEMTNQALLKLNKLQQAQQSELTRFLAVASHDLRQPMHALNLYLGALVKFDLPEAVRPVVNNLRHCARNMDDMFANLLDLSRLDAQIVQPQLIHFSINDILSKLDVEFSPQAHAKGLQFHIFPSTATVESDPALIEQILRNLIANAIRYTPAGQVQLICSEVENHLQIAVEDTGIGISRHDQETIFEEFFQVDSDRRTKGMGLGLAIVQRLVRLLHIPIQLASEPGHGSTFTISLPKVADQLTASEYDRQKSNPTASLLQALIVVVEDDENILYAMRALLEQWDSRVITATSGAAALKLCSEEIKIPDLLICDYRLNLNETGIDVITNLREEFNHQIPAILITGDISPQLSFDAKAAELILMHKPVQADVLHETVSQLLSKAKQA